MGSGKGKARRTKVVNVPSLLAAKANAFQTDVSAFSRFVAEQNLMGVKATSYYDVPRPAGISKPGVYKYEKKLAKEVFRDLVTVGAIQLPSAVSVEDFGFYIQSDRKSVV